MPLHAVAAITRMATARQSRRRTSEHPTGSMSYSDPKGRPDVLAAQGPTLDQSAGDKLDLCRGGGTVFCRAYGCPCVSQAYVSSRAKITRR